MALSDETEADQAGAGARLLWRLRPATPGFPVRCELVMNADGILLRARIGEEVLYAERFAASDVDAAERVAGEIRSRLMKAGWLTERRQDGKDGNGVA